MIFLKLIEIRSHKVVKISINSSNKDDNSKYSKNVQDPTRDVLLDIKVKFVYCCPNFEQDTSIFLHKSLENI